MHTTRKPMRILSLLLSVLLLAGMLSAGVAAEETGPFQGTSVTLGSNLLVNFYAEVTDTEGAVMTFLVNGSEQSVPVTQARHIEGNLYAFSCSLAPAQMTDTVQATLTDSGNTYQTSTSVRVYAQKLFASKQWDMLAANDMMLATLNYGAATQNYFGYNHNDLANDGYVKDNFGSVWIRLTEQDSGRLLFEKRLGASVTDPGQPSRIALENTEVQAGAVYILSLEGEKGMEGSSYFFSPWITEGFHSGYPLIINGEYQDCNLYMQIR